MPDAPREGLTPLLLSPLREWRAALRVPRLWQVEARLQWAYMLRLPAWFIYRERKALGIFRFDDESFFFGETPYDVAVDICRRAGLGVDDVLVDLGCGRGKMAFTARLSTGCTAVGVDLLATYISTASGIARSLGIDRLTFSRQDVLEVPLDEATAVYVNGWTFSDDLTGGLRARISVLADDVWWISVGREWSHPRLHLRDHGRYPFSWGWADVWLYRTGPAGISPVPGATNGPSFHDVLSSTLHREEEEP